MEAYIQEWLNLLVRFVHVVAAIMWIGDSFLFMFLDKSLEPSRTERSGDVMGEMWMTHGGGFYELVKRRSLRQDELPPVLHWFKWESYTTWISGFFLLVIVYYMGGAMLLTNPSGISLLPWQAALLSVGVLALGWILYDILCTVFVRQTFFLAILCVLLLIGISYGLTFVFSPRAVFLHIGAMMATVMSGNVFFRIIPGQKKMMADTLANREVNTMYGVRAKVRSTHNHYITFPVLFMMLSNHFPLLYGFTHPWLMISALFVFGVGVKHWMNVKSAVNPALVTLTLSAFGGIIWMTYPQQTAKPISTANLPAVSDERVWMIIQSRCVTCHAQKTTHPAFPEAQGGVRFDSLQNVQQFAERIYIRAVETRTMPLANLTTMTDAEREEIGRWYLQGRND